MTIKAVHLYHYHLPLLQTLPARGQDVADREGLLIVLTDDRGRRGYGEAAPLPGLSQESLSEVRQDLPGLLKELTGQPVPRDIDGLRQTMARITPAEGTAPSLAFGLEAALANLAARSAGHSLAEFLGRDRSDDHVPINALIWGDDATALTAQARAYLKQGFRAIKMKVAPQPLEAAIQCVQAVCQELGDQAVLRLDVNQGWDLADAVRFGEAVGIRHIEYIEEPLRDPLQAADFYQQTLLPVALDESLAELDLSRVSAIEGVEVLVIKPTLFGGITRLWDLADEARARGLRLVISSAYETAVGVHTLAGLAAALTHNVPAGLPALGWFKNDLWPDAQTFENGQLILAHEPAPPNLQLNGLKPLL